MFYLQEQQCSTVNEQQCSTVNETVYEDECTTVNEEKCEIQYMTKYEQQCSSVNEQVCCPIADIGKQKVFALFGANANTCYDCLNKNAL